MLPAALLPAALLATLLSTALTPTGLLATRHAWHLSEPALTAALLTLTVARTLSWHADRTGALRTAVLSAARAFLTHPRNTWDAGSACLASCDAVARGAALRPEARAHVGAFGAPTRAIAHAFARGARRFGYTPAGLPAGRHAAGAAALLAGHGRSARLATRPAARVARESAIAIV